ncbi:MAG: hypothetical protein DI535_14325 [Citrobacter freundii]|nr:MAG: hypothetical protein DI535_14325 [Citrobacter freundii]
MALTPELKNHFLHLYQLALSDADVDIKELEILYRLGEDRGLTRTEMDSFLLQPQNEELQPPQTVLEKVDCLYDLSLIAWADGKVEPAERAMLGSYCARFGFREENIAAICEFLLDAASQNIPKQQILTTVSQNL